MKLIVIAALVAVCAAGRLDHLERSYLPPENSIRSGKPSNNFRGLGSSFDVDSAFGQQNFPSGSNRYLPPSKRGPLPNHATSQLVGNVQEPDQEYSFPSKSYGAPHSGSQSQFGAASRQYLAPNIQSQQNNELASPNNRYLSPPFSQNGHQFASAAKNQYQMFGADNTHSKNQQFRTATSRQYLAPEAVGANNNRQRFGASSNNQQQTYGAASSRQYLSPQNNNFPANLMQVTATSRQYLAPPRAGFQGSGNQNFAGFSPEHQQARSMVNKQYSSAAEQMHVAQNDSPKFGSRPVYSAPQVSSLQKPFGSRFQSMVGNENLKGASRQYLAPRTDSFQQQPQQAFNEKTGYQY